jgi:Holliday junction DNA helicase RuvA
MISRVRGTLLRRDLGTIEVMTASGVAYELDVPLTVYEQLPRAGAEVELRTFLVQREDGVTLYGFSNGEQRALFARLLTASGVGPRLALNMLSTLSPERVIRAIVDQDIATLRQIPGLGTKKAQKLVVELADRLSDIAITSGGAKPAGPGAEEAVSALVALGYTHPQAAAAVRAALVADKALANPEQVIRAALARLASD